VERIHANGYEFILHFDVDVIADFQATNYPGTGGLSLEDVRQALEVFVTQKHLAAIEVAAYNPTKDPDGRAAKLTVDLLTEVLAKRLEILKSAQTASAQVAASAAPAPASGTASLEKEVPAAEQSDEQQSPAHAAVAPPPVAAAWSSDSLEIESASDPENPESDPHELSGESSGEQEESSS
jgi:hypothetical protein